MSDENKIKCPKCKHLFVLTDALAGPLLEAERKAAQEREQNLRLAADRTIEEATAKARKEGAEAGRAQFADDMARTARKAADADEALRILRNQMAEQEAKLAVAQGAQAEALRLQREMADAKRELDLTIETRVSNALTVVREDAERIANSANALKLAEKEKALAELREQLAEATRKAEHTDNRIQGEVQEIELARLLGEAFPRDIVEDVAKGVHGGDVVLRVRVGAAEAGAILFESKRTKNYDPKWLEKLRADQRNAGAAVAVLVTQTMPKGVEAFDLVDGVWICSLALAAPLTAALRLGIVETYAARKASDGQETKAGLLYAYLVGPKFKARLQGAIECVVALQSGLTKERAAIERQWAARSTTHDKLVGAFMGLSGDLGGIASDEVAVLEGFDMAALGEVKA